MEKKSSYRKLKEQLAEEKAKNQRLYNDFRKFVNGDFQTTELYKIIFRNEDDQEKLIWFGTPSGIKKD